MRRSAKQRHAIKHSLLTTYAADIILSLDSRHTTLSSEAIAAIILLPLDVWGRLAQATGMRTFLEKSEILFIVRLEHNRNQIRLTLVN